MLHSSNEPGGHMVPQFWRSRVSLQQEFSRMEAASPVREHRDAANRLETLLARELPHPENLRAARSRVAASAAHLPITPEMAWTLPQLLKRVQLVSPGIMSTSAVLRFLIRTPQWDGQIAKAFADSGFLTCDRAIGRVRWKYEIGEMMAKQRDGSAWEVLEHCRSLLTQQRAKQPVDWDAVLGELHTLASWFPELRTIHLLQQLYSRLCALHSKSVLVVQCWLDWRSGVDGVTPEVSALQGVRHA